MYDCSGEEAVFIIVGGGGDLFVCHGWPGMELITCTSVKTEIQVISKCVKVNHFTILYHDAQ